MVAVKLTKTELREQQNRFSQLSTYLPVLQLKKALLQVEVERKRKELEEIEIYYKGLLEQVDRFTALFNQTHAFDLFKNIEISEVKSTTEHIAGVEVPCFEEAIFNESSYSCYILPAWIDTAIEVVRELLITRERLLFAEKRKELFEKELIEVSIRVNLFEKILIPRAKENIKRIKIFLSDQQLAAVGQAKVAKKKILLRKAAEEAVL